MRNQHHPNILPLLHSHTYGQQCNLIFPLASYNLKEFYKLEPHPPPGEPRLRFIERISRLVPALGMIHQGEIDSVNRYIGFHRDLKPDNILVFGSTQRFMISDLGLMKVRKVKPSAREYTGVEWRGGLSAYKAPECEVKGKKVGRGADIFSLGCILAEAITWSVTGKQGLDEFQNRRFAETSDGVSSDQFFNKSSSGSGGKEITQLKPQVLGWFDEIRRKSDYDPLVCGSLDLVVSMLKENPRGAKGRPTAEKIDCDFYKLLKEEAERFGTQLTIQEPPYYSRFDRRQALPFSYNRATSMISATQSPLVSPISPLVTKRRRSEDESFMPPPMATGNSFRPIKRMKEVSAFVHLKRLDTMFLVDDYITETPWEKLQRTISKLADIATEWDQDGVDLAFINNRKYFSCLGATKDVMAAMNYVGPSSDCECILSRRLDEILSEYVALFRKDRFTKPLNLIVVTSGAFLQQDEFEIKIMEWARELDLLFAPKSQMGLQFVLVGCRKDNVKRFQRLDEELYRDFGVR
jgi:serine/threonine protein kinase